MPIRTRALTFAKVSRSAVHPGLGSGPRQQSAFRFPHRPGRLHLGLPDGFEADDGASVLRHDEHTCLETEIKPRGLIWAAHGRT